MLTQIDGVNAKSRSRGKDICDVPLKNSQGRNTFQQQVTFARYVSISPAEVLCPDTLKRMACVVACRSRIGIGMGI